jgi:hypothetical protein
MGGNKRFRQAEFKRGAQSLAAGADPCVAAISGSFRLTVSKVARALSAALLY